MSRRHPLEIKAEIERMKKEAFEEQERELTENFAKLNLENRAKLTMYSRELLEDEQSAALKERVMRAFDRLNKEGQALFLAYIEAIAANPKYRKMERRKTQ